MYYCDIVRYITVPHLRTSFSSILNPIVFTCQRPPPSTPLSPLLLLNNNSRTTQTHRQSLRLCVSASLRLYVSASLRLCVSTSLRLCVSASLSLCVSASLRLYVSASLRLCVSTSLRLWVCVCSVVVVHLLGCVSLFVIPWTDAHQASLSFTISLSLLKLMSI